MKIVIFIGIFVALWECWALYDQIVNKQDKPQAVYFMKKDNMPQAPMPPEEDMVVYNISDIGIIADKDQEEAALPKGNQAPEISILCNPQMEVQKDGVLYIPIKDAIFPDIANDPNYMTVKKIGTDKAGNGIYKRVYYSIEGCYSIDLSGSPVWE